MSFLNYTKVPLDEGTVYQTQSEKDAFLKDKTNIANYFMFNFFGMLGIMSFFQGKSPIVAYFSTDQKHQLNNITDTNTDMSLCIKLMEEAGGLSTTTANNLTKFLVLVKNKSITAQNFDEKIVRAWATEVKTSTCKPSPAILAAFEDFESGKSTLAQFTKVIFYLKALKQYAPSVGIFRDMCHHAYSAFKNIPDVGSVPAVPAAIQKATQPTKPVDPVKQSVTTVDPVAAKVAPTPPVVQAKVVDLEFYKKAWAVDGKAALTKLCKEYNTEFKILDFIKFFEANPLEFKLTLNSATVLKNAKENSGSYTNYVRTIIIKLIAAYPLETLELVQQLPSTKNIFKNASYSFGASARDAAQAAITKQIRDGIDKAPLTAIAFNEIKTRADKYNLAMNEWLGATSFNVSAYSRVQYEDSAPLKAVLYGISTNALWSETATKAFNRFNFGVRSTPAAFIIIETGMTNSADLAMVKSAEDLLKARGYSTSASSVLDLLLENRFKNNQSYKNFLYKVGQLSNDLREQVMPKILDLLKTNTEDQAMFSAWIFEDYNNFSDHSPLFFAQSKQELVDIIRVCKPLFAKQTKRISTEYFGSSTIKRIDGATGNLGEAVREVFSEVVKDYDLNDFLPTTQYTLDFVNTMYQIAGFDETKLTNFFIEVLNRSNGIETISKHASSSVFTIQFDRVFLNAYFDVLRDDISLISNTYGSYVGNFVAKYFDSFTSTQQATLLSASDKIPTLLLRYNPNIVTTLPVETFANTPLSTIVGFIDNANADMRNNRAEFFKEQMKEVIESSLEDAVAFKMSDANPSVLFQAIELVGTPKDFEKLVTYHISSGNAMKIANYLVRFTDRNKNLDEWLTEQTLLSLSNSASEFIELKHDDASSRKQLANVMTDAIYTIYDTSPEKAEKAYSKLGPAMKRATIKHLTQIATASIAMNEIFNSDSPIKPYSKMDHKRLIEVLKYNDIPVSEASLPGYNSKKAESLKALTNNLPPAPEIKKLNVTQPQMMQEDLDAMSIEYDAFNRYKHGDIALRFLRAFDVEIPTQIDSVKTWNEAHPTAEVVSPAFHGTGSIGASMILRYGFKVINAGDGLVVGRMLGDGIYFSNVLDKVGQYVGDAGYSRGSGTKGYIFEMDANLGTKEDYSSAGVSDGRTVSPEWCVFTPNSQLRIKKAFEVEIIQGHTMRQMKKAAGLTESAVTPLKKFTSFKKESSVANTHAISYVFMDGSIPVGKDKKLPFEDFKKLNLKNVRVDLSGQGPVVVISDTFESLAFVVSSTNQFLDETGELNKFLKLIGK